MYGNPSLLCFRKIPVAKKYMEKGENQDFASKHFCPTVTKNAIGEPVNISLISGIENVWMRGWRGAENFPSKLSFLTVPEIFVRQTFRVSLLSGLEEFYASEVYVTIFCRIFLSHGAEKPCRGTLLCFVSENFR